MTRSVSAAGRERVTPRLSGSCDLVCQAAPSSRGPPTTPRSFPPPQSPRGAAGFTGILLGLAWLPALQPAAKLASV
jgi:hypothetical protein